MNTNNPSDKNRTKDLEQDANDNAKESRNLDDPQNMINQANGLVLNDFDSKDGKVFEYSALNLKNQFQQANIYTRHFPININSFKGPYENAPVVTTNQVSTWYDY